MIKPIIKKRVSDEVVEQIKMMIIEKKMVAGDKLPSERELMELFQIGRTAIREALRILENNNIIEVKSGKGSYVGDPSEKGFETLEYWLAFKQENLHEHFEVRLLIEPRAAYLSAQRSTDKDIKVLRSIHNKFVEAFKDKKDQEIIKIDAEFHYRIAEATSNKTLSVLMQTFNQSLLEGWKATLQIPERAYKTIDEHKEILDGIIYKSPEKASISMQRHLENAIAELVKSGMMKQRF